MTKNAAYKAAAMASAAASVVQLEVEAGAVVAEVVAREAGGETWAQPQKTGSAA